MSLSLPYYLPAANHPIYLQFRPIIFVLFSRGEVECWHNQCGWCDLEEDGECTAFQLVVACSNSLECIISCFNAHHYQYLRFWGKFLCVFWEIWTPPNLSAWLSSSSNFGGPPPSQSCFTRFLFFYAKPRHNWD